MNLIEPDRSDRMPDALIFDLDGTLLDTYAAHFRAYEVMLQHFSIEVTPERLHEVYQPDWFQVYRALGVPEEHWPLADEIWLAEAARHRALLFPGVEQMLKELHERFRMGIVTSGSGGRVRRDLSYVGISRYFQAIVTGDDVSEPKPSPEGILTAARALRVSPARALYVGDTLIDHLTARAAGMPFVGVAGPLLPAHDSHPFRVLGAAIEVPDFLAQNYG